MPPKRSSGSFRSPDVRQLRARRRGAGIARHPHRNGGTDPQGFDCSGFTQYVFAKFGITLPRDVRSQYRIGKSIEPEEILARRPRLLATTDPGASHVAIAIGGDGFVHAPSTWGTVRVEF